MQHAEQAVVEGKTAGWARAGNMHDPDALDGTDLNACLFARCDP